MFPPPTLTNAVNPARGEGGKICPISTSPFMEFFMATALKVQFFQYAYK